MRRQLIARPAFPPDQIAAAVRVAVEELLTELLPKRRLRRQRQTQSQQADHPASEESAAATILRASLEVRGPLLYATLIIAASVAPLVFLGGLTGSFARPLVASYLLAVLASTVVALVVTPALAMLLLPRAPLERRESPLVRWLVAMPSG